MNVRMPRGPAYAVHPKRNKYGSKKTTVDGITFDSKKEAVRWQELKLLQRSGQISNLQRQVRFYLYSCKGGEPAPIMMRSERYANGRQATLVIDFVYREDGKQVLEDVKGTTTPLARLKIAILEAMTGTRVRIT